MPRVKQFDPDKLLETAMLMFWEKGYEATSMRDIVERSGVNQFGIYGLYGDKHGLYVAALDKYRDDIVGRVFGIVERSDASWGAIHEYFDMLVRCHSEIMRALGCFMANAMADIAGNDDEVRERTKAHLERQRAGFTQALTRARDSGEIPAATDIAAMAEYLVISVQGLAVYSRIHPASEALTTYTRSVLQNICQSELSA